MNTVILYSLSEEILLDDLTTIIANLHGENDHYSVRESIKNHPNFKQNYQELVVHLFGVLTKKLAHACNQYHVSEIDFFLPSSVDSNPTALCNHTQASFDVLMALVYMPLHSKYDYGSDDLEVAAHTYFWWEELESDFTYLKLLELFDISN